VSAPVAHPDVSVVIPVLNEAETIDACLDQFDPDGSIEVLVVDGGSEDGTADRVQAHAKARLIRADAQGRAHQMNQGGREATGRVVLFLHSDCELPDAWEHDVRQVMDQQDVVGGRFRLAIADESLSFRLIAFFSTLRSRFLGITYGDQGIFVRKSVFDSVGGFPPRMIFEDSEFCDQIAKRGRFVMTKSAVKSSPRRWLAWGIWKTVFRMWYLRLLYACSVSDERLVRMYRHVR